jgi:hypothetical protein
MVACCCLMQLSAPTDLWILGPETLRSSDLKHNTHVMALCLFSDLARRRSCDALRNAICFALNQVQGGGKSAWKVLPHASSGCHRVDVTRYLLVLEIP